MLSTRPAGIGWIEQPIVLPLGIQRHTLRRSLFLDRHGAPYGEQLKFIRTIRPITVKMALANLHRLHTRPALLGESGRREIPERAETLCRRCPVLHDLVGKCFSGRVLRHEEKVILFYSMGLIDRSSPILHQVLEHCPDYHYEKVQRQINRMKPHPISCLKIRELIPEVTASLSCNCSFDLRGGKYPSPLLHLNPHLVPASEEFSIPEGTTVKELARRYLNLRRRLEEENRALAHLEATLDKYCDRKKIDQIQVDRVRLRRSHVSVSGKSCWEIEPV